VATLVSVTPDLPIDSDTDVDDDPSGRPRPAHLRPALIGLVWLGGALGTTTRYLLGLAFPPAHGVPITTMLINVVGAFLLGVLFEALAGRHGRGRRQSIRLLAGTGFLGGFTTYSALAVDAVNLTGSGRVGAAAGYALLTLVVGAFASFAGIHVGGSGRQRARP
jgi:fluoride exporter